jgi:uncharacterized protein with FMN-binding domain
VRRIFLSVVGFCLTVVTLVGLKSATAAHTLGWSDEAPFDPDDPLVAGGDGTEPGATPDLPGVTVSVAPDSSGPAGTTDPAPGSSTGGPAPGQSTGGPQPTTPRPTTPAPAPSKTYTGVAVAVKTAQTPTAKSGPCGECEDYTISVTITVSNGKITAASVAYNRSPGASQTYASRAHNSLKNSIVTAQKWNLGRISGATYAGNAWELSAKDAMSKAGLPV